MNTMFPPQGTYFETVLTLTFALAANCVELLQFAICKLFGPTLNTTITKHCRALNRLWIRCAPVTARLQSTWDRLNRGLQDNKLIIEMDVQVRGFEELLVTSEERLVRLRVIEWDMATVGGIQQALLVGRDDTLDRLLYTVRCPPLEIHHCFLFSNAVRIMVGLRDFLHMCNCVHLTACVRQSEGNDLHIEYLAAFPEPGCLQDHEQAQGLENNWEVFLSLLAKCIGLKRQKRGWLYPGNETSVLLPKGFPNWPSFYRVAGGGASSICRTVFTSDADVVIAMSKTVVLFLVKNSGMKVFGSADDRPREAEWSSYAAARICATAIGSLGHVGELLLTIMNVLIVQRDEYDCGRIYISHQLSKISPGDSPFAFEMANKGFVIPEPICPLSSSLPNSTHFRRLDIWCLRFMLALSSVLSEILRNVVNNPCEVPRLNRFDVGRTAFCIFRFTMKPKSWTVFLGTAALFVNVLARCTARQKFAWGIHCRRSESAERTSLATTTGEYIRLGGGCPASMTMVNSVHMHQNQVQSPVLFRNFGSMDAGAMRKIPGSLRIRSNPIEIPFCYGRKRFRAKPAVHDRRAEPLGFELVLHAPQHSNKVIETSRCPILAFDHDPCNTLEHMRCVMMNTARNCIGELQVMVNIVANPCKILGRVFPLIEERVPQFPVGLSFEQNMLTFAVNTAVQPSTERQRYIKRKLYGLIFRFSANSFYQTKDTTRGGAVHCRRNDVGARKGERRIQPRPRHGPERRSVGAELRESARARAGRRGNAKFAAERGKKMGRQCGVRQGGPEGNEGHVRQSRRCRRKGRRCCRPAARGPAQVAFGTISALVKQSRSWPSGMHIKRMLEDAPAKATVANALPGCTFPNKHHVQSVGNIVRVEG